MAHCECGHADSIHRFDRKTRTRRCYHKLAGYTSRFCACERWRPAPASVPQDDAQPGYHRYHWLRGLSGARIAYAVRSEPADTSTAMRHRSERWQWPPDGKSDADITPSPWHATESEARDDARAAHQQEVSR